VRDTRRRPRSPLCRATSWVAGSSHPATSSHRRHRLRRQGRSDIDGVATENITPVRRGTRPWRPRRLQHFPKAKRFKDYRECSIGRQKLRRGHVSIPTTHTRPPDRGDEARQARVRAESAGAYPRRVRALEQAAKKYKVATQMGNQGHAAEGTRKIRELVEAGAIGTVRKCAFGRTAVVAAGPRAAAARVLRARHARLEPVAGPAPERPTTRRTRRSKWRGGWTSHREPLATLACTLVEPPSGLLDLGFPARRARVAAALQGNRPLRVTDHLVIPAKGSRPELKVCGSDNSLYPARPPESVTTRRGHRTPAAANSGSGPTASSWRGRMRRSHGSRPRGRRRRGAPTPAEYAPSPGGVADGSPRA